MSFYSTLYDKIPEDHLLKRIDSAVDFGFINELLAGSYCRDFGRPAKEPELMMKILLLQYLYDLSDVKVIEEAKSMHEYIKGKKSQKGILVVRQSVSDIRTKKKNT